MTDDETPPTTVYLATGNTRKRLAVHVERACKQLANPQTGEITAHPPQTVTLTDDGELPSGYKWCGTCVDGHRFGTGSPAREILSNADPEDIPP